MLIPGIPKFPGALQMKKVQVESNEILPVLRGWMLVLVMGIVELVSVLVKMGVCFAVMEVLFEEC